MYVFPSDVNVYPVPTFAVSAITVSPFLIIASFATAFILATVILGWQTMFVPLVLNPFPFISEVVSPLSFPITSAQSSLFFISLVAIYPVIPLDVIILSHI